MAETITDISKAQFNILEKLYTNDIIEESKKISPLEMEERFGIVRKTLLRNRDFLVGYGLLYEFRDEKVERVWKTYILTDFGIVVYLKYLADRTDVILKPTIGVNMNDNKMWNAMKDGMKHFPLIKTEHVSDFFQVLKYNNYFLMKLNDMYTAEMQIQVKSNTELIGLSKLVNVITPSPEFDNDEDDDALERPRNIITFAYYMFGMMMINAYPNDKKENEKVREIKKVISEDKVLLNLMKKMSKDSQKNLTAVNKILKLF